MDRTILLSLQLSLEFLDLLQNPWVIGRILNCLAFKPLLAAALNPIDEGEKQPHGNIQALSVSARPDDQIGKPIGSRASTTARRCGRCLLPSRK